MNKKTNEILYQKKHDLTLRGFYFIPSTTLNCKSEPVMLAFMVWTTARIIHHMCCYSTAQHSTAYTLHISAYVLCSVLVRFFLFSTLYFSLEKRDFFFQIVLTLFLIRPCQINAIYVYFMVSAHTYTQREHISK